MSAAPDKEAKAMSIFFIQINFDKQVHAPALGFTEVVYDYVQAENKAAAEALAIKFYLRKYGQIKKIRSKS